MLNIIKGCEVPFPEKLKESYEIRENSILANVDAEKIEEVFQHFIVMHEEPLFFILELPANIEKETEIRPGVVEKLHCDVYYIDGCSQDEALAILIRVGEILINDGMCSFGFGGHESNDEIMAEKYNVITIYSQNIENFNGFFEMHNIERVDSVITAWDTFSEENPGVSNLYKINGKTVYDIPDMFKEWGIYLAETREE